MTDIHLPDVIQIRQCFETMLRHAPSVFVVIDARKSDVVVPHHLKCEDLSLQIGYDMAIPIPDLEMDEQGIRATLSFNQAPFHCTIPWHAIKYMRTEGPISEELRRAIDLKLSDPESPLNEDIEIPVSEEERRKKLRAKFEVINGEKK